MRQCIYEKLQVNELGDLSAISCKLTLHYLFDRNHQPVEQQPIHLSNQPAEHVTLHEAYSKIDAARRAHMLEINSFMEQVVAGEAGAACAEKGARHDICLTYETRKRTDRATHLGAWVYQGGVPFLQECLQKWMAFEGLDASFSQGIGTDRELELVALISREGGYYAVHSFYQPGNVELMGRLDAGGVVQNSWWVSILEIGDYSGPVYIPVLYVVGEVDYDLGGWKALTELPEGLRLASNLHRQLNADQGLDEGALLPFPAYNSPEAAELKKWLDYDVEHTRRGLLSDQELELLQVVKDEMEGKRNELIKQMHQLSDKAIAQQVALLESFTGFKIGTHIEHRSTGVQGRIRGGQYSMKAALLVQPLDEKMMGWPITEELKRGDWVKIEAPNELLA